MKLSRNVGTPDRVVRIILGIALGAAFLGGLVAAPLGFLLAALAVIMLATGATGFCPLYALFGVKTCPLQRT